MTPKSALRFVSSVFGLSLALSFGAAAPPAKARPLAIQTTEVAPLEALPRIARPLVVAHRGCHAPSPTRHVGGAPENSLLALENCIAVGADMMETDIRRSRDGVLVIMHDATVDRTTDGHGRVADLTAAEITRLHLREGFGGPDAPLTGQTAPTLAALLAAAKGRLAINLDIKEAIYPATLAESARLGVLNQVLVKDFAGPADTALGARPPYAATWFMPMIDERQHKVAQDQVAAVIAAQAHIAQGERLPNVRNVEVVYTTPAYFAAARTAAQAAGLRLWVNTLGPTYAAGLWDQDAVTAPEAVWGELIRNGVNIIQTDAPAALLDYLGAAPH